MTDIFENELDSQKQLINDLVSKCKKLVGSFKLNDGLMCRLKDKQESCLSFLHLVTRCKKDKQMHSSENEWDILEELCVIVSLYKTIV